MQLCQLTKNTLKPLIIVGGANNEKGGGPGKGFAGPGGGFFVLVAVVACHNFYFH